VGRKRTQLLQIGWREWVQLPQLTKKPIKVKVDTGAQTSALHATEIRILRRGKKRYVSFRIHPVQRSSLPSKLVKAELVEKRDIRSSLGQLSRRPVIRTVLKVNGIEKEIELTLVNRDLMGFRMLLGRQALRGDFTINPAKSFVLGVPKKKKSS